MYQFSKIKLIIWDLDDTFWQGIFSEGPVAIPPEHRALLETLTDIGIVNSICSKNDPGQITPYLEQNGLRDFFCFPSVAWTPKGPRVQQLITDMQLRPCNVLFLDDNPSNLGEVRYHCPDIMVGGPDLIPRLIRDADAAEKKDLTHSRLRNYRLLEKKQDAKNEFASNEEFLYQSCVCVDIQSDCLAQIERIHDLILRSNQLNFTKIRSTPDELRALLEDDSICSGYVSVRDKFGDYGIVGFFSVKDNRLLHFVFSCRALGMGVEQYVYNSLNRPSLEIVGEVVSDLSSTDIPGWINHTQAALTDDRLQINDLSSHTVLMKGPCDLIQILPFIAGSELFDTEFTYTLPNGTLIESVGHTTNILESLRLSDAQKRLVSEEFSFLDMGMYSDKIFRGNYRVVFLSILADCNLGVYRRKDTGEQFAFGEYLHPLTDAENWHKLISGEYFTANYPFTEAILKEFTEKYTFLGRNTPELILENLRVIRRNLPQSCILSIMLGSETPYEKNTNAAYTDRHIVHKAVNDRIREWAAQDPGIRLVDVNSYITGQNCFNNHPNHYTKPVYFSLSQEIVQITNEALGRQFFKISHLKKFRIYIRQHCKLCYRKLVNLLKGHTNRGNC